FDYTLAHWLTFLSAAALLNLSPGPDIAFILGHTFRSGRRSGFAALFGIWSGACLHVLMAAAGLSAILAASAIAFSAVKWAGAAYLIWLGIQALRSKGEGAWIKEAGEGVAWYPLLREGLFVSAVHPEGGLLLPAFPPAVRRQGRGPGLGAAPPPRQPHLRGRPLHRTAAHSSRWSPCRGTAAQSKHGP